MKNIIFIAPPAAGKGTQSMLLKENYNYIHISTGDLLRDAIKSGSELGKMVGEIIAGGNLVSDSIMIELIKETLVTLPKNTPFILDGYPRTINQAKSLKDLLVELGINDILAIYLKLDMIEAMHRAIGRVTCSNCKKGYNIYFDTMKPLVEGICDICGSTLDHRTDDNEEAFKVRFQSYIDNSSPVVEFYKNLGILNEVEVNREPNEIYKDIVKLISEE